MEEKDRWPIERVTKYMTWGWELFWAGGTLLVLWLMAEEGEFAKVLKYAAVVGIIWIYVESRFQKLEKKIQLSKRT